jgi:cobalt/nickel transport system permease protein
MQTKLLRGSILHGIPAGIKLPLALLLVMVIALLPRRPDLIYFWPAGLLVVLFLLGRVPLLFAAKRLLLLEFFILGFGIFALINPAGRPVFLSAFIKSNLCVLAMVTLAWTTPFHELLHVLRKWRVPEIMLSTLALMHRYLPVLVDESRRMQRARASRTFHPRQRLAWENVTLIIGQLFVRGAERAERIYLAMCARGWK